MQLTCFDILLPPVKPLPLIDLPTAGGTYRLNIADNNKALPEDRIYFVYNHYKNAFQVDPGAASAQPPSQFSISRYTVGFEKVLFDDWFSLEVRAPFVGTYQYSSDEFGVVAQNAGNLAAITKVLLTESDTTSTVVGLGINMPTGTDVNGNALKGLSIVDYTVQNEAVHLLPYFGLLTLPTDQTFFHMFLQLDLAANGNPVWLRGDGSPARTDLGTFTQQNLLYVDVAGGPGSIGIKTGED